MLPNPPAIGQNVEVIVEHFRRHVMGEIDGQAKAMVVTQSREHPLRYYFGVRNYFEKNGYTDMMALVAFSGELEMDGEAWTEAAIDGFSETGLPQRFGGERPDGTPYEVQHKVLIVAEKYALLKPGEWEALRPISELGAKSYTEGRLT